MRENQSKPFRIEAEITGENGKVAVLELHGFLDAHTVRDFEAKTAELLDAGLVGFIIDTGGLDFISSAGLGSLMHLSKQLRKKGGDIILLDPPARILTILDLMSFTKVHRFASSVDEALELLQQKS